MKKFIEDDNSLKALFEFSNFLEAIDFVNQVADVVMQLDHHPDILIHEAKSVTITTTSHDAGNTITAKDKELAKKIEDLLE